MVSNSTVSTFVNSTTATVIANDLNVTATNWTMTENEVPDDSVLMHYVIMPMGMILIIILGIVAIILIVRKHRLDKLRHHLMPLYSFDPAEEGEDWEAELLEEGVDHNPRGKNSKSDQPQLSFHGNL